MNCGSSRAGSLSVLTISALKPAGAQHVLDAAHDRREQRVGQVGDDQADRRRPAVLRLRAIGLGW